MSFSENSTPEQQDLLQMLQRCIVIQAVAAVGMPGGGQQDVWS